MKQKKLIFFTRPISPSWNEGSKNFAYSLAKNLKLSKTKVCLLTTRQKIPSLPSGVTQIFLHPNSKFNWQAKLRLLKFLVFTDAEIIHFIFVPIFSTSLIIKLIKAFKKFKAVQTVVSLETKNLYLLKKMVYGDQVVCFTRKTNSLLSRARIKNIRVVPPGIDLIVFRPQKKQKIIAFLGELHRLQSFEIVLKMIPLLLQSLPDYQLVLGFRTPPYLKQEIRLAHRLKKIFRQEKRFSFVSVIENMPEFLAKTKLVLFPAFKMKGKFDLPLVLLESLACAAPVVISPIEPLTELLDYRGVSAPSQNKADSFAAVVKKLLSENFSQSSKQARKTAENFFDIKKIAQEYQKIYEKISE